MLTGAYLLYLAGLAVAFGLRSWLQVRRTGSAGFNGVSGRAGSLPWWAGVLFALALVLGVLGPALALTGAVPALEDVPHRGLVVAGAVLLVAGLSGVLVAQSGMGASWRIGVAEGERTELVTTGVFAVVRNPVFTAMVVAQLGMTLVVPTPVTLAALVCLVVAVELQVRLIEEPHLARVHGASYHRYTARAGRFLPGVGRRPTRSGS